MPQIGEHFFTWLWLKCFSLHHRQAPSPLHLCLYLKRVDAQTVQRRERFAIDFQRKMLDEKSYNSNHHRRRRLTLSSCCSLVNVFAICHIFVILKLRGMKVSRVWRYFDIIPHYFPITGFNAPSIYYSENIAQLCVPNCLSRSLAATSVEHPLILGFSLDDEIFCVVVFHMSHLCSPYKF